MTVWEWPSRISIGSIQPAQCFRPWVGTSSRDTPKRLRATFLGRAGMLAAALGIELPRDAISWPAPFLEPVGLACAPRIGACAQQSRHRIAPGLLV